MRSYVFIAGGIGITPFRSILMELLHKKKQVSLTLLYCVSRKEEILFSTVLRKAEKELGIKIIYLIKEKREILTKQLVVEQISEYQIKQFYLSGSQSFVLYYQQMLLELGLPQKQIRIDSFSGYA